MTKTQIHGYNNVDVYISIKIYFYLIAENAFHFFANGWKQYFAFIKYLAL